PAASREGPSGTTSSGLRSAAGDHWRRSMETGSRAPDHPTDAELRERLLAREADPHVAQCARCSRRAETIGRAIDPLQDDSTPKAFDDLFYRRQAARIRARIAAGEGRRLPALPRLAWAGGAAAALVAVA